MTGSMGSGPKVRLIRQVVSGRLCRSSLSRRVLGCGAVLVLATVGVFTLGAAQSAFLPRATAKSSAKRGREFAVVLPAPSAGDVTYGVAQVQISGSRLSAPSGVGRERPVFSQHLGGLSVVARSPQWRSLRKTTRVYVVVTRVPGASSQLRAIAFFIARRLAGGKPANSAEGKLTFTINNAQPDTSSFWVRGVSAAGYAEIFAVRNTLSTALGNWTRYIDALKVAHALEAATKAVPTQAARLGAPRTAARTTKPAIWTGGQRPDKLVTEMYDLLFGSIGDATGYAGAKKDPLVAEFIDDELHNPALAARWQRVTAQVPLKVPDKYAAAANEEKLFAPRLGRAHAAQVSGPACNLGNNASAYAGCYAPSQGPIVTVVKSGTGTGTVTDPAYWDTLASIDCGTVCSERVTSFDFLAVVGELNAVPDPGSSFVGWSTSSGAKCFPLAGYPDGCFLASDSSATTVTATFAQGSATVGSITEFNVPTSGAQPDGIASGPDGNLWFTEELGDKIGVITPGGSITEYSLPVGQPIEPTSIAVDGANLWFIGAYNSAIGEITPSGQISWYPLPGSPFGSQAPNAITLGPDGNLWFTDNYANMIGRLEPSQASPGTSDGISEFPIPTSDSSPEGITAGPDGNVWFTETYTNKIGRVVPADVSAGTSDGISEYPIPSPGDGPAQITAGPDGNLWFTDVYSGDIGRIVPADVSEGTSDGITYYEPPTSDSGPVGITSGPDGNLWFTEQRANNIGRLVPADVSAGTSDGISEFPVPTVGSEPESLAPGPDGNIWFTELEGDKIGRVVTGAG